MDWYIIIIIFIWIVLICMGFLAIVSTYAVARRILLRIKEREENNTADKSHKQRKPSEKNYTEWSVVKILIIVLCAAILFIGFAITAKYLWGFEVENSEIVLTFVGIIATFVVVSNYAQVNEIKKDLYQKNYDFTKKKRRFDNLITNSTRFDNTHADVVPASSIPLTKQPATPKREAKK